MNPVHTSELQFRYAVVPEDRHVVRRIVESTDFFSPGEIDIAVELVDERLAKGDGSGYHFIFAERDGRTIGYACYGPIPCSNISFDLYWVAVQADQQGHGLGRALVAEAERLIPQQGGRQIYLDTSGRDQYAPTRAFYDRCGFAVAAILTDFYDLGDAKYIYRKPLA